MKALGTGHSQGVLWRDIEVVRRPGGPRNCGFTAARPGASRKSAAAPPSSRSTHADTLAFAQAIILGE